jgi:hypothetical protein
MTDTVQDQMYAAAVTLAEQAAVAAMNREATFAKHTAQALELVAPLQRLVPRADEQAGLTLVERSEP